MKKIIVLVSCLLMAMLFLPGAMASWEGLLSVDGRVTVIEPGPETYELTISITGEGTTSPAKGTHRIESGETVYLGAYAADGWVFENWVVQGHLIEYSREISFHMLGDITFRAVFVEEVPSDDADERTPELRTEQHEPAIEENHEPGEAEDKKEGGSENGGHETDPGSSGSGESKEGGSENGSGEFNGEGSDDNSDDNNETATVNGDNGNGTD